MNILLSIFQIGIPAFYLLFFPGLFISFIFFELDEIDIVERIALSVALSMTIIPLLTYYTAQTGVSLTPGLVMVILFCLFIFTAFCLGIKWFLKRKSN